MQEWSNAVRRMNANVKINMVSQKTYDKRASSSFIITIYRYYLIPKTTLTKESYKSE
jgi:hypothetical protein